MELRGDAQGRRFQQRSSEHRAMIIEGFKIRFFAYYCCGNIGLSHGTKAVPGIMSYICTCLNFFCILFFHKYIAGCLSLFLGSFTY